MAIGDRWQLNEEDSWAEESSEPERPESADLLYGQDPDGAVTAIVALSSVAVVVVGLITAAITALVSTIQPINLQAKSTRKTIEELGDKWSKPNNGVELDDGSVSDGDGSNWEVRRGSQSFRSHPPVSSGCRPTGCAG